MFWLTINKVCEKIIIFTSSVVYPIIVSQMYVKLMSYGTAVIETFYSDKKGRYISHLLFLQAVYSWDLNPIKSIAYTRRYKEFSCYRPIISVTVQALIKVSQPIGERDGSNQRSPTQSAIAASKPNFTGYALSPRNGTVHGSANVHH